MVDTILIPNESNGSTLASQLESPIFAHNYREQMNAPTTKIHAHSQSQSQQLNEIFDHVSLHLQ